MDSVSEDLDRLASKIQDLRVVQVKDSEEDVSADLRPEDFHQQMILDRLSTQVQSLTRTFTRHHQLRSRNRGKKQKKRQTTAESNSPSPSVTQDTQRDWEAAFSRIGISRYHLRFRYLQRFLVLLLVFYLVSWQNALSSVLTGHRTPLVRVLVPAWGDGEARPDPPVYRFAPTHVLPDLGHQIFGWPWTRGLEPPEAFQGSLGEEFEEVQKYFTAPQEDRTLLDHFLERFQRLQEDAKQLREAWLRGETLGEEAGDGEDSVSLPHWDEVHLLPSANGRNTRGTRDGEALKLPSEDILIAPRPHTDLRIPWQEETTPAELLDHLHWFPNSFVLAAQGLAGMLWIIHPKRFVILRHLIAVFTLMFLMRSITIIVTSLPDPSPMCTSQFSTEDGTYKTQPIFPDSIIRAGKVLHELGQHVTCGDMVYSAHTTFLVMGSLVFFTYCRPEELKLWERGAKGPTPATYRLCALLRWLCYSISSTGVIVVIGTRLHYTLDVLIAVYLSIRTWNTYWAYANFPEVKATSRIMSWLEDDAEVVSVDALAFHSFWWEEFVCQRPHRDPATGSVSSPPSDAVKQE